MDERSFLPRLDILPPSQRRLWGELDRTPENFTLYGGTGLALHLGHRISVDFDFFSAQGFDPDRLMRDIGYLHGAERVQVEANTLTCRVERGGPILVSYFGGLGLGQVAPHERDPTTGLAIASLLDLAGTKAAVVQKRAQVKDYLDIEALLQHGIDLSTVLAAGQVVYGRDFNPLITLKALSYFDDLPRLPADARRRLGAAVAAVDLLRLPLLVPYKARPDAEGCAP
jgi:hypothetical protein